MQGQPNITFMVCLTTLLAAHVRGSLTALSDLERMWKEVTVVDGTAPQ
jgi:hypothetical protein